MAEWLKGRNKIRNILGLLKDQTAASLARTSGLNSPLQSAIVKATTHSINLPEEKYVEQILAAGSGSRMQVTHCTRELVKKLTKTQSWAVAIKCLVIIHRTLLEGSFLFQDQLAYNASKEGGDYLSFVNFRGDLSSLDWELSFWVKLYAKYLDERLICSRELKNHFDSKWSREKIKNRVQYMESEELLEDLTYLQNLMEELCRCQVGSEAGQNAVIQGALILVVSDSYKLQDEIRLRIQELLERAGNLLNFSAGLRLLQICKRAESQMEALRCFLRACKELTLLSDVPLPEKAWVSALNLEKLTATIKTPTGPLYTKRSATSSGENPPLKRTSSGFFSRERGSQPPSIGQGVLQRTTSQPMNQPRHLGVNGNPPREALYSDANLQGYQSSSVNSCPDLIDLSSDPKLPSVGEGTELALVPRDMTQDLICWSPHERTPQAMHSADWEDVLLNSMRSLSTGASQISTNSSHQMGLPSQSFEPRVEDNLYRFKVTQ